MPDPNKPAAGSKAKGKYALDAGDLLGGILSETQDEAAQEEQRLRAELQARMDAERLAKEEESLRKRRAVVEALAEEEARQEAAAALRDRVQQVVEELEHETASGTLQALPEEAPARPVDFATHVRHSQSYAHPAVPEGRPLWLMAAIVATVVLLVGGGAVTAFVLMSGPSLDPNSYPKSSLNLEGVTNNGSILVALNHVPEPEPVPSVAPEGVGEVVQATTDSGREHSRDRSRERERERERQREQERENQGQPLDISLDGSGIFDRGSE